MLNKDIIFRFFLLKIIFTILNSNQQLCIIRVLVDCYTDSPNQWFPCNRALCSVTLQFATRRSLLSHPLNRGWFSYLLWLIECSRNDKPIMMDIHLKKPCTFLSLGFCCAIRTSPG